MKKVIFVTRPYKMVCLSRIWAGIVQRMKQGNKIADKVAEDMNTNPHLHLCSIICRLPNSVEQ